MIQAAVVILKKRYLPSVPAKTISSNIAIGHFDGIEILEFKIKRLKEISEKYDEYVEGFLNEDKFPNIVYSRPIYLINTDIVNKCTKEYPLTFVTLLTFANNNNDVGSIKNKISEFKNKLNQTDIVNDVYISLGCSNVAIITKSNCYAAALDLISNIACDSDIIYSCTISSISSKVLDPSNELRHTWEQAETQYHRKFNSNIQIRCIIKSYSCFEKLISKIIEDNDYKKYLSLGSDDVIIDYGQFSVEKLLKYYDKIFKDCKNLVSKAVYSMEVCIGIENAVLDINNILHIDDSDNGSIDDSDNGSIDDSDILLPIFDKINTLPFNDYKEHYKELVYAIVPQLTALKQLSIGGFVPLVKQNTKSAFKAFLEIIDRDLNTLDLKSAQNFLLNFDMMMESYLHADKHFIEMPGYNALINDAPAKLVQLYMAFIDKAIKVCSTSDNLIVKYLLCTSIDINIETEIVLPSTKEFPRLLIVRASSKFMFSPRYFLPQLAHEVAHYSGVDIRKREFRNDKLIDSAINELICCLMASNDSNWKYYEDTKKALMDFVKLYMETARIDFICVPPSPENNLTYISSLIDKVCVEFASEPDIFIQFICKNIGNIYWDIYDIDQLQILLKRIGMLSIELIDEPIDSISDNNITFMTKMKVMFSLVKECYADIIMIIMLNMPIDAYIESLMEFNKHTNKKLNIEQLIRLYEVINALDLLTEHKRELNIALTDANDQVLGNDSFKFDKGLEVIFTEKSVSNIRTYLKHIVNNINKLWRHYRSELEDIRWLYEIACKNPLEFTKDTYNKLKQFMYKDLNENE